MADDIINSNGQQSQGTEPKETAAQKLNKYNKDYAEASAVLDTAKNAYESGKKNNDEFVNSGLNTTVAKDSKGNAIGTYDWDAQAEHTAKISYNSDVLAAKQDATAAKQELVTNQQQGQAQHDMAGYSANQSAEKAGWTGGYVLDSNRQVAFLKESIKANLYSQEELQKYGYDTALAAARANYDLKKSELAMQNYNTAVQNALQMAEFTGKFISPEASYHLSQLGIAQKIKESGATGEELTKAEEVIASVNSWFEGNNISKEGVYCMSILMQNYSQASEVVNNIANAIDTLNTMLASNQEVVDTANKEAQRTGMFSYVDEYGEIQKVSANWATAMVDGKMPEGFENWTDTAKAEYKSILGNVIAGDLKNRVEAHEELLNKDFADEASAQAAINNAIFNIKNKYSDDIDDVAIGEINITVTINGTTMSIPLTSSTVAGYKTKYNEPSSATINLKNTQAANLEEMGSLSNEQMAEEAKTYIWFGDVIVASGNKKAHHGDDVILTINGTTLDTKYEYDKDYGDTTGNILNVLFNTDTEKSSNAYKAAQAILQNMSNDSYAVIPVASGNDTAYAVVVKDDEGHYSYLRDKSASTEGSKEIATSSAIQTLAAKIMETPKKSN